MSDTAQATACVYVLGNDGVADWLEVFARSLRRTNPDLETRLIPFDDRLRRTERICRRARIPILDPVLAERADGVAAKLGATRGSVAAGTYRKLAAFLGPFETFLFLDADIVVLEPLAPLLERFRASGSDLAYFDTDLDQVFRDGELRRSLAGSGELPGFNTGAFLARRAAFEWADIERCAEEGSKVTGEFAPTYEQPFLNFLFVGGNRRCVPIRSLVDGLGPTWPGFAALGESANVRAILCGDRRPGVGLRSPFVHWAGYELKWVMPYAGLVRHFAPAGLLLRLAFRRWRGALRFGLQGRAIS